MKKGYYIHLGGEKTSGVAKKIKMQIEELRKFYEVSEIIVSDIPRTIVQRIIGLLPFMSISRDYETAKVNIINPDFVYIRRAVADREYYLFLKWIKQTYPACKVIVEIFTYPYDRDEFAKWDAWPFYFKELLYRGRLKKVIDRFVTYSSDKEIFGVPCINTINGTKVDKINAVKPDKPDNNIDLIAVANFQRSHGYERILKGMYEYKRTNPVNAAEIVLHLVGTGKEESKYRKCVHKWNLEKNVIFYGKKQGDELDDIYAKADIALGVFGLYKVGIADISSLKVSEYLAKGMPIIGGCRENAFANRDFKYYQGFENNKSSVDMRKVIDFYQYVIRKEPQELIREIREFAEENVDMEVVFLPIVKFIDEKK